MGQEPNFELLLEASRQAAREGRHSWGAQQAEQALSLREDGEAWSLLALHRLRIGDLKGCLMACHSGQPLLEKLAPSAVLAQLLGTQAVACLQAEMVTQGLRWAQSAVLVAAQTQDPLAKAWANTRLAQAHSILGDHETAQTLFDQALEDATRMRESALQFSIQYNRAWIIVEGVLRESRPSEAQLAEALQRLESAQVLAENDNNVHSRGVCLLNRSRIFLARGQLQRSWELATEAQELGRQHGLVQLSVGAQTVLCEVSLQDGKGGRALQDLLAARATVPEEDRTSQLDLLRLLVRAQRQQGLFEDALKSFEELHTVALHQAKARADLQAWLSLHEYEVEKERLRAQRAELETELHKVQASKWESEAHHDALTGLANRRFVQNRLPELLNHAHQGTKTLWAAMFDLDHFKQINDTFGHDVGDQVLRTVGEVLRGHVRSRDLPARWGGEEFLVLIADATREQALETCERLRKILSQKPWGQFATGLTVTTSVGLAAIPGLEAPWEAADAALYRAKQGGRNRVVS